MRLLHVFIAVSFFAVAACQESDDGSLAMHYEDPATSAAHEVSANLTIERLNALKASFLAQQGNADQRSVIESFISYVERSSRASTVAPSTPNQYGPGGYAPMNNVPFSEAGETVGEHNNERATGLL